MSYYSSLPCSILILIYMAGKKYNDIGSLFYSWEIVTTFSYSISLIFFNINIPYSGKMCLLCSVDVLDKTINGNSLRWQYCGRCSFYMVVSKSLGLVIHVIHRYTLFSVTVHINCLYHFIPSKYVIHMKDTDFLYQIYI